MMNTDVLFRNIQSGTARLVRHALRAARPLLVVLAGTSLLAWGAQNRRPQSNGVVASYTFGGGSGSVVQDQSGHHNDGVIVGPYDWTSDRKSGGLRLDGKSYVRVSPSPSLDLSRAFSLITWVQGAGARLRFVEDPADDPFEHGQGRHFRRGPYFQVCGDKLFFTYNADVLFSGDERDPTAHFTSFPMWIGTASANLASWSEQSTLMEGIEPKLQVTEKDIHYEYFGRDGADVMQIWTATSAHDLSAFTPIDQTHRPDKPGVDPNGTEQEGNLQVVGERAYYAFPEVDDPRGQVLQLWTAVSDQDDTHLNATQRTTTGTFVPLLQVAGNSVYYYYGVGGFSIFGKASIARSDLDGSHWHVIATLPAMGAFKVDKDRIFFMYPRFSSLPDGATQAQLVVGSMGLDGQESASRSVAAADSPRQEGQEARTIEAGDIQVVGDKVYFSWTESLSAYDEGIKTWTIPELSSWMASSQRDGSMGRVRRITGSPSEGMLGYKPFVIVGGKTYFGVSRVYSYRDHRTALGTSGSNIINKGDAFGIGLSEEADVSAFINAGEDYLYRGEAPLDTGGATAVGALSDQSLHQVAAVYDGRRLALYIDGSQVSAKEYRTPPARNDFPLLLGDGLVGTLREVRIHNTALDAHDIEKLYQDGLTAHGGFR
jgi:hypothetical protein